MRHHFVTSGWPRPDYRMASKVPAITPKPVYADSSHAPRLEARPLKHKTETQTTRSYGAELLRIKYCHDIGKAGILNRLDKARKQGSERLGLAGLRHSASI